MQRLDMNSLATKFAAKQLAHVAANIVDYQVVSPDVVKVIATFNTPEATATDMYTAVANVFKGNATPIEGSFRRLKGASIIACVGFVRANTIVREYEKAEVARMKVMSSNLLMSPEDETLWEVRSSGNAKYLARQSKDDLSSLVALAKVRNFQAPKLDAVAVASVQRSEFVAFVNTATQEMDYGFVVKASEDTVDVVNVDGDEVEVSPTTVVESAFLNGDDKRFAEKAGIESPSSQGDKQSMISYYSELYGYAPDYAKELVDIISSHAAF